MYRTEDLIGMMRRNREGSLSGGDMDFMSLIGGQMPQHDPASVMGDITDQIKRRIAMKAAMQQAGQGPPSPPGGIPQPGGATLIPGTTPDNSYAGVSAAKIASDPRVSRPGGLPIGDAVTMGVGGDNLIHNLNFTNAIRGDSGPRFVNSVGKPPEGTTPNLTANREAYKARQESRQADMASHRGQYMAQQKQNAGNSAYMRYVAGLDPEVQREIVRTQGGAYQANLEDSRRRGENDIAKDKINKDFIASIMGAEGLTPEDRRAALMQGGMGGNAFSSPGNGSPSPTDIQGRIAAARGVGGTDAGDVAAPPSVNELLDQLTPEQAKGMSRDQILKYGLTEDTIAKRVSELENNEVQRRNSFGRMMDSDSLGLGVRDPAEVQQAARRMMTAIALLNAIRGANMGQPTASVAAR